MSTVFKGIAASSGIAIGKAYLHLQPNLSFKKYAISNAEEEIHRLHSAFNAAKSDLENMRLQTESLLGKEEAAIFNCYTDDIYDSELLIAVTNIINTKKVNAETALANAIDKNKLNNHEQNQQEYHQKNKFYEQLLGYFTKKGSVRFDLVAEKSIVIMDRLKPDFLEQINNDNICGFITTDKSCEVYTALLAKSVGKPAIIHVRDVVDYVKQGDLMIVDGFSGDLHINPTPEILRYYEEYLQKVKN